MSWTQDLWRIGQWVTLSFLILNLTWGLHRRVGAWIFFAFQLQIWRGLHILYFGYPSEPKFNFQLSVVSGEAVLWLVASALVLLRLKPEHWSEFFRPAFALAGTVNALVMIGTHFALGQIYGIVPSPAMNSAFLACCVPMAAFLPRWRVGSTCVVIMAVAIFMAGQTTGIVGLAAALIVTQLFEPKLTWQTKAKLGILTAGVLLCLAYAFMPKGDFSVSQFLSSRGRFQAWELTMQQFLSGNATQAMLGRGPGTFEWLFPIFQYRSSVPTQYFLWAHNDWIQALLESGAVGFSALFSLALLVSERARKSPELAGVFVAYGIASLTQAPLRVAPFQILGIALLAATLPDRGPWDPFASMRPEPHD